MKNGSYVIKERIEKAGLWKTPRTALGMLDIELTERCNNDCIHCCINLPQDDQAAKKRELSTVEIKNILKEAESLSCMRVRFTGGEPLLREDFEELYLFARRLGLRVLIFTNAALITARLADLFSHIPPLEPLEITLYGMKKASYEAATRTEGSFEPARRGIELLRKNNIPFIVKTALFACNTDEMDEFERWAADIPWMDKPPSYSMFFDLRCRRDDDAKNELIRRLRLSPDDGVKVLARRREKYIEETREFCSKFTSPPGEVIFSCGSGVGGGCVDAYGYFQPCMMLRHPDCVYDLKKGTLKDALENFFPEMRQMKAGNPEYLKRCARCFLKGLCQQCPAKSWMEYGTLDTPVDYLCDITHAQARYLGMIGDDEKTWEVSDWKERIRNFCKKEVVYNGSAG